MKKKDTNKITLPFQISKEGKFLLNQNDREALKKFNEDHTEAQGEMMLEILDGSKAKRHWQHRKYRADILPSIAEICGEVDLDYFHEWGLKPKFKTFHIKDVKELPPRYISGSKKGRFNFITEIIDGVTEKRIEYVPSTASFTIEEMDQYIDDCKTLLNGLMGANSLEEIQERMRVNGKN